MRARTLPFYLFLVTIAALVAAAIAYGITGIDFFEEGMVMTYFSGLLILIAALISLAIFRVRLPAYPDTGWLRSPALIWLIIAVGFAFLAADEIYEIHETVDFKIHEILNIEETRVTDRIDDALVGIYGFIGLAVLYIFKRELLTFRKVLPYFKWGFILVFIMIILDSFVNGNDFLPLIFEEDLAWNIKLGIEVFEDSLKMIAEVIFIAALYDVYETARDRQPARKLLNHENN